MASNSDTYLDLLRNLVLDVGKLAGEASHLELSQRGGKGDPAALADLADLPGAAFRETLQAFEYAVREHARETDAEVAKRSGIRYANCPCDTKVVDLRGSFLPSAAHLRL